MYLTGRIRVVKCKKATKARFFNKLQADDELDVSTPFAAPGRNRGLYASQVKLVSKRLDESTVGSMTEILNRLTCFEWEEIQSR